MARKENGTRAGDAKQKCAEVHKSKKGDNYNADPLSFSNHLSPLSSPIMTLFQSLNVEIQPLQDEEVSKSKRWGTPLRASHVRRSQSEGTNLHSGHKEERRPPHKRSSSLDNICCDDIDSGVCKPKSPYSYYSKSLEGEFSAQQDNKPENSTIRTSSLKKYAGAMTTRSAPSVDADDDTTVAASGSGRNVMKRSQSLIGGTDEQFMVAGKIFSLGDEIARTEARLVELKREKQELEHLLKGNSQATFGRPPIYTSAPTLPSEIDMKPSRRRRRVKSFEAGRPAALPNDGDLFEKTIAAAKRAQNRALWKEREVDADVFSLLHLWESIEIGGEKHDNTSSPNRSQISDSNMPEKKQLFPRSA